MTTQTPTERVSTESSIQCARALNPGRPLGEKARAIRDAVLELTVEHGVMTVRQVFYALVVRGVVPKDEGGGYRPVQRQVLLMRREGLLPWSFIADTTRWQRKAKSYDSADDALAGWARSYRRNLWADQGVRVEVWLEKDALAGIVWEATDRWDVALMVSRGTASATFLHSAGEAARAAWMGGVETHVFALYDFDAAGARAARAVERGLVEHSVGAPVHFQRLAVTAEQITEWALPTRPAKKTDPESAKLIRERSCRTRRDPTGPPRRARRRRHRRARRSGRVARREDGRGGGTHRPPGVGEGWVAVTSTSPMDVTRRPSRRESRGTDVATAVEVEELLDFPEIGERVGQAVAP